MNDTTKLKWFRFDQNNSGGYFVQDENQAEYVFVQACDRAEAQDRIEDKLDYSYCECCGERWYGCEDGTDAPMIYDKPAAETPKSVFREEYRLHFYDGRVEAHKFLEVGDDHR